MAARKAPHKGLTAPVENAATRGAAQEALAAHQSMVPQARPAMLDLLPEEREALRVYVARRVTELREHRDQTGESLARRAKGEWMLELYRAEGHRVGAALLAELIADTYGVTR